MGSTAADVRARINRARAGTFFAPSDFPVEKRTAVETALSRLAAEGKLARVRRGLYWKGEKSRFGPGRPDPEAVARKAVGHRGFGPTGWSASHALGLTTQVPARPMFVVVGPTPAGVDDTDFCSRWNFERLQLDPAEIALLEVLRSWPHFVDVDWEGLRARVRTLAESGRIRLDRVVKVAATERSKRVRDLARELAQEELVPSA